MDNGYGSYMVYKSSGIWVISLIYVLALMGGIFSFFYFDSYSDFVRLFVADFVGTVVVWFFGVVLRNSSVYDPYWSVAPPVMLSLYAFYIGNFNPLVILLLLSVWGWGIRLTMNWRYTFQNLTIQDWRYDKYKNEFPRIWHLINLTGINLMPTIIVFLAMVPGIFIIKNNYSLNIFSVIGFMVCICAICIQYISDKQIHQFRKANPGKVCNSGLWKYSRHPNYVGEIMMWWGVYFMLFSVNTELWWTGLGALVNTLLFVFISIPMMEKRQLRYKPEYHEYKSKTGMLIPRF